MLKETQRSMKGQNMQISIIIPVYNEEESIISVLKELEDVLNGSRLGHEIIVVNDGSTDRTSEVLRNSVEYQSA